MRLLIGAAAAALLFASPALAQTATIPASCAGFEAAPATPDGAVANSREMQEGATRFDAWRAAREQKLATCQADAAALRAQLEATVAAFNAAGTERVTAVTAWNAEIEEFNARGSTNNRSRGGVIGGSRQ